MKEKEQTAKWKWKRRFFYPALSHKTNGRKGKKKKKTDGLFHVQKLWYNGQAIYDFWISSVMKAAFDAAIYMEGGP